MLFTHRGLSGPSILQISSYWKLRSEDIEINLSPQVDILDYSAGQKEEKILSKKLLSIVGQRFCQKDLAVILFVI